MRSLLEQEMHKWHYTEERIKKSDEPLGLQGIAYAIGIQQFYEFIKDGCFINEAFSVFGNQLLNKIWSLSERITPNNLCDYNTDIESIREAIIWLLRYNTHIVYTQETSVKNNGNGHATNHRDAWATKNEKAKKRIVGTFNKKGGKVRGPGRYSGK